MQLRALFVEDDAVSSVLGVVLMVAVTIVLAAVVGTFVLGIGEELTDESPQVSFDYSFDVNESGDSSVLILHGAGDELDRSTLEVTVAGETAYEAGESRNGYTVNDPWPEQIRSGDRLGFEGDAIEGGDTVRIFWHSGDRSAIIGEERIR